MNKRWIYLLAVIVGTYVLWKIYCTCNNATECELSHNHSVIDSLGIDHDTMDNLSRSFGMSYNLMDEEKIMKSICDKSVAELAEYADIVARTNSNNLNFLREQFDGPNVDWDDMTVTSSMMNPTSIGNIACIATYSPEPYKSKAMKFLQAILANLCV